MVCGPPETFNRVDTLGKLNRETFNAEGMKDCALFIEGSHKSSEPPSLSVTKG